MLQPICVWLGFDQIPGLFSLTQSVSNWQCRQHLEVSKRGQKRRAKRFCVVKNCPSHNVFLPVFNPLKSNLKPSVTPSLPGQSQEVIMCLPAQISSVWRHQKRKSSPLQVSLFFKVTLCIRGSWSVKKNMETFKTVAFYRRTYTFNEKALNNLLICPCWKTMSNKTHPLTT